MSDFAILEALDARFSESPGPCRSIPIRMAKAPVPLEREFKSSFDRPRPVSTLHIGSVPKRTNAPGGGRRTEISLDRCPANEGNAHRWRKKDSTQSVFGERIMCSLCGRSARRADVEGPIGRVEFHGDDPVNIPPCEKAPVHKWTRNGHDATGKQLKRCSLCAIVRRASEAIRGEAA